MDEYGDEAVQSLHFFYDAQSRPAFVEYNGAKYRYLHNLQGDIVGIVDNNGNLVVEYRYDAWGKPILTTGTLKTSLGELNPFRYRGYVYDEETELYYLRSRYYNPEVGRFISADVLLGEVKHLLSHNTYVYTKCRPTMRIDYSGNRDIIYSSYDSFVVENDYFFHDFYYGTDYYVETSDGTRYRANSYETVSLTAWTTLDTEFMENEFDTLIDNAAPYASMESIFRESIGGELDFKRKLDKQKVYLMNGIVYNTNEAGNFIWAYFLKVHNYLDSFHELLAQGGSLVSDIRFDESHDRAARYAGLKYWYKREGKEWLFRLLHGIRDRV